MFWSSGLTKIASWGHHGRALFRDEYMVPLVPPEIAAVMSATFRTFMLGADRRRLGDAASRPCRSLA